MRERDPLAARLVAGLHVEGPFLNESPGSIGAHPAGHARPADPGSMNRLLNAGGGLVRLVTLVPERDPDSGVTRLLAGAGVTVAAGHCDRSRDALAAARAAGLTLFTHLGDGCPALLPRHDNVIPRALSPRERLRFTLGAWELEVGADLACRAPAGDHLAGSTPPLGEAKRRLVANGGFSEAEAATLCGANPRRFLGPS